MILDKLLAKFNKKTEQQNWPSKKRKTDTVVTSEVDTWKLAPFIENHVYMLSAKKLIKYFHESSRKIDKGTFFNIQNIIIEFLYGFINKF